jgi:hypothetical protein
MSGIDSIDSMNGTDTFSVDLGEGEGTLNITVSAFADAEADAAGNTESESAPGAQEQSTKDMEGVGADYGAEESEGPEAGEGQGGEEAGESGAGEKAGEAVNGEIETLKEGIADGLSAIEEMQPGFIEDILSMIEGEGEGGDVKAAEGVDTEGTGAAENTSEGTEASETVDAAKAGDAAEGTEAAEDTSEGTEASETVDAVKADDAAEAGEGEDVGNDLLASLEELAASLEEIIGMLGGGGTEEASPATGEGEAAPSAKAADAGVTEGPEADVEDVAEGLAEEVGDGEVPAETETSPVDTFIEIYEQMSPEAQDEVVEILASGAFGEEGVEAAETVVSETAGETGEQAAQPVTLDA